MNTYSEHIAQVSAALADPTRREIMELVLYADSPLSVREVADHFGLHANAARLHLDKLVKGGLLKTVRRRGGRGGRPANLYGASDEDRELNLPPRSYKLLAEVLASGVADRYGELGERLGDEAFRRGREEALTGSSPLARMPAEAGLMDICEAWREDIWRRGHKVSLRRLGDEACEATFIGCPFGDFSRDFPQLVCGIHRRMEEGSLSLAGALLLEATVRRCVFNLRRDERGPA